MKGHPAKHKKPLPTPQDKEGFETFEQLVRKNTGWMLKLANRILNDEAEAENAVQNAFSNIYKGLDGFENRASIKTWIHRIVINEALMLLRKKKQLNEQSLDEFLPQFDYNGCRIEQGAATWDTAETHLTTRQTRETISKEISELPDGYRIVLVLRDIEAIPTTEVAAMLNLTTTNVRVKLHRARAALKKRLDPLILRGEL